MAPKPKLLTPQRKSYAKLGASASKKPKNPLMQNTAKKTGGAKLPEPAFAIPGFGQTGLTGES